MDVVIAPHKLTGTIDAIASKSMAHRLLICAALCQSPTDITCTTTSKDIEATIDCLRALGARITRDENVLHVVPIQSAPHAPKQYYAHHKSLLDCGESGSTLRFMLPVAAGLACNALLTGHGRLSERPLSPLYEELIAGGCELSEQGVFPLSVKGGLRPGRFELPGNVSSQYISGLLLAAPIMKGTTEVCVSNPIESKPYIDLTIDALKTFGVHVGQTQEADHGATYTIFSVSADELYTTPGDVVVEGDWSNAAFWFAAGALGEGITVNNINLLSRQGDKAVLAALAKLGARIERQGQSATAQHSTTQATIIDAANFPDLVPPLAAVAACTPGHTTITNCARLRLKESNRIETVCAGLSALGAAINSTANTIEIDGKEALSGGCVDAANDHRIAMMAAIAASRCTENVKIIGAHCVDKSYPTFFDDYATLGGNVTIIG